MKTSEIVIGGVVVIGVVAAIYYLTQRPAASQTTVINQPKKDNLWSFLSSVTGTAGDVATKALNSGGGQRQSNQAPGANTTPAGDDYTLPPLKLGVYG